MISITSVLVICNLWSTVGIIITLIGDICDNLFTLSMEHSVHRRLVRFALLSFTFIGAYLLRYHLAFLVSLGGIIATLCSLAMTMPLVIYLFTFWKHPTKSLSTVSKIFHIILLTFVVLIALLAAYINITNVY